MSPIRNLIAASIAAVAAAALPAHTAPAAGVSDALPRPTPAIDAGGTVMSLRVVPGAASTDVMIGVNGSVAVKDFTLTSPDKIVLDLAGATLGLQRGDTYDRIARGGIVDVRYSQFNRTVVRVVLTLDAPHAYTVRQSNGQITVSVNGASVSMAAWSARTGDAAALATVTPQGVAASAPMHASAAAPPLAFAHAAAPYVGNARPAGVPAPTAAVQQPSQQPPITINALDEDIRDVLAEFQEFSGRTIIPGKNVTGKVTAYIVNKPWDVALRALLNANGFDATVDQNGIIIVDTYQSIAARQSAEPLVTETVRLNYARAVSVAPMVKERLSRDCSRAGFTSTQSGVTVPQPAATAANQAPPGSDVATQTQEAQPVGPVTMSLSCPQRGAVTFDSLTNSISITDVPSSLKMLEDYARSLDLRQPQVNIKAKIILVDRTAIEDLGLRYDLGTQNQFFNGVVPRLDSSGTKLPGEGQVALGGNSIAAIANASQRVAGATLQLVYSTAMGNFDLTTFLEALRTTSLVDVQAEPSASVLNNRTANLTAGTQVPIRVIDAGAGGTGSGSFPTSAVKFQQTGVILTVTPQVTANHQIQMRVHVENSDVQFQSNDVGAVFPTQSVDNEVLVADGETAVMGGLTQNSINISKTGIPILVDLPVIGRLFGETRRQETKRDLLILITPHIIDPGQSPDGGN
jgi:type IV pilus assembly protein PilQ